MRFNRLISLALCLGVVFLIMTGSAVAGVTSFNSGNALTYAKEIAATNGVYTIPAGSMITRTLTIIRSPAQPFFVDLILDSGATWAGTIASGDLTVTTTTAGVSYTANLQPVLFSNTRTWKVDITGNENTYPTVTFTANGAQVKDANNIIGTSGTINVTLQTRDAATGNIVDAGTDQVPFVTGKYGVKLDTMDAGAATIDVAKDRKKFVGDTVIDDSPVITIINVTGVLNQAGTQFMLASSDTLDFIITGDLSGVSAIQLGATTKTISSSELAASSKTITLAGTASTSPIVITVDGITQLNPRTLAITINLNMVQTDAANDSSNPNDRALANAVTFTVWKLNGSVLIATWANGNNAALNSRFYLFNNSSINGLVTIEAWTLPNAAATASTKIGSVDYGILPANSFVNIKLAEDVLNPLGVTLPYLDNGGNVAVKITIRAPNVTGLSQTFSGVLAYGTYPLLVLQ